jgi:heme-degrading monooxygenase HmoA
MFTRHVIMQLKPNTTTTEFTDVVESKILPLLRKQKGFRDEITFLAPDRSEAIAISFWDTKEAAEAYNLSGYPEVLKTLTNLVEGTPRVGTAEVATSTFHKLAAAKTA